MSAAIQQAADLGRILNRHAPSMGDSGFTITTPHGELAIPPGRLACHIADLVAQDARLALMRLDAVNQMGALS